MGNKYQGKHILVMGYALSGKSVVDYLLAEQARVTVNDRGDLSKDPSVNLLLEAGVEVVDGGHPLALLEGIDFIVKSPVIPYHLPIIKEAIKRSIPIYTDIELAYRESQAPIIAITGSNGKTTTTSLIQHLLQASVPGQVRIAGNIGVASLDVVRQASKKDRVIMEVSSFQLMGIDQFQPQIAVITNITSAHLDYHGSRGEYIAAKLRILNKLTPKNYVVYNADQDEFEDWLQECPATLIPFSRQRIVEAGAYYSKGIIYFQKEPIARIDGFQLPGDHNIENALAAIAVAKLQGVSNQQIQEALTSFNGIRHRIQWLGNFHGIDIYNDSKATNTVATITALKSFNKEVIYIGGGLDRGNDFKDLIPYLTHVKVAYLYGQSKDKMKIDFERGQVDSIQLFDQLEQAVEQALQKAQPGQIVLFSPACASWDQFDNYEQRGDLFISTVETWYQNSKEE